MSRCRRGPGGSAGRGFESTVTPRGPVPELQGAVGRRGARVQRARRGLRSGLPVAKSRPRGRARWPRCPCNEGGGEARRGEGPSALAIGVRVMRLTGGALDEPDELLADLVQAG